MKLNLPWKKEKDEGQLAFESMLGEILVPVNPRPGFKHSLSRRLQSSFSAPTVVILPEINKPTFTAIWGIAGLLGGALVILTGLRALYTLLSRKAKSGKKQKNLPQEEPAPALTAAG